MLEPLLWLLWVLICVVAIIGLAYWFTRSVGRGGLGALGGYGGSEQLRVLARLSLGKEQFLALVQAGERFFLLGVTPAAVSSLAELTREEAAVWLESLPPEQPGFGESLRSVLRQRKQR